MIYAVGYTGTPLSALPIITYLLDILLHAASLHFSFITYQVEIIILTA